MPKSASHKKRLKYRRQRTPQAPWVVAFRRLQRHIWLWHRLITLFLIEVLRRSLRALVISLLKLIRLFEKLQQQVKNQAKPQNKLRTKLTWRRPPVPSLARLSVLSLFGLAGLSYYGITQPSANTLNCRGQINGRWQTNLGEISLQEQSDQVTAKFSYHNINRGKVTSQINGQLDHDILNFDWQEQAEQGTTTSQGQGILLFRQQCQEFYGTYSSVSLKNGSFQGILIQAIATN